METMYYRITSGNLGIYEVVEKDCPKNDPRRNNKPDGSWLNKIGTDYPGCISFWTEKGMNKYISSGLLDWHQSVVSNPLMVQIATPKSVVYEDDYQIIVNPQEIRINTEIPLKEFLQTKA